MNTATFANGTKFRFDGLGGGERNEALPPRPPTRPSLKGSSGAVGGSW